MSSIAHTAKRVLRIILAVLSSIVLIGVFAVLAVIDMPQMAVDRAGAALASDHDIVQQRLQAYCPARVRLTDSTDWGDSGYRASEGDIATVSAYAAFGSVYASSASSLADSSGTDLTLDAPSSAGRQDAMVGKDDSDRSRMLSTNLLEAGDGSGHAGVIASHAAAGDLRGISAGTCVTPAVRQSFLLSATTTGVTQQLVIANPSSKAAVVTVTATGTERAGHMGLATAGTVTVTANGETTVDLSAAASGQQGLYVTLTSAGGTPVAAAVRTLAADGLTPKGSDFAMPLEAPAALTAIPGVAEGDKVSLYLYGDQSGRADVSWMTDDGTVPIRTERTKARRVSVIDLGEAPQGAHAVLVASDVKLDATAKAVRSGENGQEDFAQLAAPVSSTSTGMALPEGFDASLVLANTSGKDVTAKVTIMDRTGKAGDAETVTVKAHASSVTALEGSAVQVEDESGSLRWNVRLTGAGLDPGKTAGLATITPTALAVREENVTAVPNHGIVR